MLPKGLLKEHSQALSIVVRGLDMAIMFLSGWVAYLIRFDTHQVGLPSHYIVGIFAGTLLTAIVFSSFDLYSSARGQGFLGYVFKLLQAVCAVALLLGGLAFLTKTGPQYSRVWYTTWMITAFVLFIVLRCGILLCLRFMRKRGLNERRVVIFGAGELGTRLANTIQQALWTGFRITTFIDDQADKKPEAVHGIPVIATPSDLGAYLREHQVDEIWLALPLRAESRVKEILHILRHHTINTRFVLDIFGMDLLNHSITDVAGFPVLNIRHTPMSGVNRIVKAIEDRIIAAIILILISPLLLFLALGVKCTSRGPVLFKQERLGWDGRVIKVYKFRTMVLHEDKPGCVTQATQDDPRITSFGRFLRRTSLDELPQFINVLQGRMSIVGPRPHALAHNEQYKDSVHTYMQRHRVKPGITGWAQVNGWRGETDTLDKMQKRVEYDLYYINNWSLGFDLKIICLTVIKGFINRNAY